MQKWGMDIAGVQVDEKLPTGRVQVNIVDDEPDYDIVHPVAWDAIELPQSIPGIKLLYHGSLALRDEISRRACRRLRDAGPSLVFVDVNLRSPWWNTKQVLEDVHGADWVKLNRAELDQLMPGTQQVHSRAAALLEKFELQGLLITDGSRGAQLMTNSGEHLATRPARDILIKDTVGAGDAMAAVMVLGILRGWPLAQSLERAQDFASAMVGQRGATVQDMNFYAAFLDRWSGE
jgi:fructokinase